jgi:hypothetical protein
MKEVKQPLLFRITYNGKSGLLLGTCHFLPINALPQKCIDAIKPCTVFVGEESYLTQHELDKHRDNFLTFYGRTSEDLDWWPLLSQEQRATVQKYFNIYLEGKFGLNSHTVDISKVKIGLIPDILHFGYRPLIQNDLAGDSSAPTVLQQDANESENIDAPGMDEQLEAMFNESVGLQSYFTNMVLESRLVVEISYLIEECIELAQALESGHKVDQDEKSAINHSEIQETIQRLVNHYAAGASLTDFHSSYEDDREDSESDNNNMRTRNAIFAKNILRYIDEKTAPILIAVGLCHLFGDTGLLMTFQRLGIKIEIFDPHIQASNPYIKFEYSYHIFLNAYNNFKNELLVRRSPTVMTKLFDLSKSQGVQFQQLTSRNDFTVETLAELKRSKLYGCFR